MNPTGIDPIEVVYKALTFYEAEMHVAIGLPQSARQHQLKELQCRVAQVKRDFERIVGSHHERE